MWTLPFLGKAKGLVPILARLYVGAALALHHGLESLRPEGVWDGGKAFVESRAQVGGWSSTLLYAAIWGEFLGACAVLLGLFTRWCALALVGIALFVIFKVHGDQGLVEREVWIARGGACLAAALLGPGPLSLDRIFFGKAAVADA
jgi:uncharacterized membrane protein YphA (DoxX/SURF4 family)